MNIGESIIQLINVRKHNQLVNDFARSKYIEKFPPNKNDQGWHSYKGFQIISETKIEVDYEYGYGDMECSGSFMVDLTTDIRDSKIDEIIK